MNSMRVGWVLLGVLSATGCDCGGTTKTARPEIEVVPGSLDFGTVPVGTSLTKKVTVFSRGSVSLTLENVTVQGDEAFVASRPTTTLLSAGTSTDVEVIFRPANFGPKSGRLIITSNAANAPEVLVSLVGDSLPPAGGGSAGGSTAGGSAAGGSTAGGSTAGGSTAGGSTAGGSTAGGSTAGGSAAGGSAAGGSAGGSTAGGASGGTSDAGVDAGCGLLLCGRAHAGVTCAEARNGSIGAFGGGWATMLFNDATGWNGASTGRTVVFGDIDGDRRADVCGRGVFGLNCALNTGTSFGAMQTWASEFSDAVGWGGAPRYYATLQLADPDGDGRKDPCGRSDAGVVCSILDAGVWRSQSFNDATAWGDPRYFGNVQFPDVTGDGKSDACGRGIFGISCSISTGTGFGPYTGWSTEFSDGLGWGSNAAYYETVQFPDVNGDGKADVCGRGVNGVVCALSDGAQFLTPTLWTMEFSDGAGWLARAQYATLQFPDLDGDGKADVCGRAAAGLLCARSTGSQFGPPTTTQLYSDASGWAASASHYATIQFADLDGDGQLDVCGRGTTGVMCALHRAGTFGSLFVTQALASDGNGWSDSTVYPTLRFAANGPSACRLGPPATPAMRVGP